jgi:LysM domain-containing protein
MVNPTRIVGLVVGAALAWACATEFNAAWAGANAGSTGTVGASSATAPGAAVEARPPGRVYLFRGALGPIFSRGMDRLTKRLENAGLQADVYEFTICRLIAEKAKREYREAPAPIILIGHSMGGLCALVLAEVLADEDIPVALVVTIDPAHVSPKVPLNVERYINIFFSNGILGGGDVVARQGYRGHYASFDLKEHDEITHINIDKADIIHDQLVNMILQLSKVPAMAEGEPLPLRYVVPPNAPLELWDSGTPISARPGQTLEQVSEAYHVPLWSLVQANRLAENAPLASGQRIIVPRHLLPMTNFLQTSSQR